MNNDSLKVELIDWIAQLEDKDALNKMLILKKKLSIKTEKPDPKIFGSGKHLVEYIAEDFNDPLDFFEAYKKWTIAQVKSKSLEIITNDSQVLKYF